MRRPALVALTLLAAAAACLVGEAPMSAPETAPPAPLGHARTNREGNDFHAPATRGEWERRRAFVRDRLLVAAGIHPLPTREARGPTQAQVYGKLLHDGYTIEKVLIPTVPRYYLSGNLYRPTTGAAPFPGVLNPHGHWAAGRSQPEVQSRCISLAKQGYVALSWDMVGRFDALPFPHTIHNDALAAWAFSLNGLQLWNSIRALDFLLEQPDVDPARVACTGASGGGTQTFELCAIDDRVRFAAPAVMVSEHFQGGCECENALLKRIDTDNIEFAACFAPKPQFLVGASGDWTANTETEVLPRLRAVYRLYGAEGQVDGVVHDFNHNYNQTSRESVYGFFARVLRDAEARVAEAPHEIEPPEAISTWDAAHPRPTDFGTPEELRATMIPLLSAQADTWRPRERSQWQRDAAMLSTALMHVLGMPPAVAAPPRREARDVPAGEGFTRDFEAALAEGLRPVRMRLHLPAPARVDTVTVIAHARGRGGVAPSTVRGLLAAGHAVLTFDAFATGRGEPALASQRQHARFFATYNRTTLAERVLDTLTAIRVAQELRGVRRVRLLGVGQAGPWALLARPFAGELDRAAINAAGFEWPVGGLPASSAMFQPACNRYGGMRTFAALGPATPLLLTHTGDLDPSWAEAAYALHDAEGRLSVSPHAPSPGQEVAFLTR